MVGDVAPSASKPRLVVVEDRDVPYNDRSDDDLMLLARGGVEEAFDALVRRHQGRVLQIAKKFLGSNALAEDAAQDAFVELYRYLPRYRPDGKLRVLLYRITINRCRMSARTTRRSRLVLTDPPERSVEAVAEDRVLRREKQREVQRAVDQLTPTLRSVVTLRYAGDMTQPEIAEALDIPVGTVKSRLFHGMKKLRALLEGGDK